MECAILIGVFVYYNLTHLINSVVADLWLGLKYENLGTGLGRQLVWRDGTLPDFANFGVGEPDIDTEEDALCILMDHSSPFRWAAVDCEESKKYVCEKPTGKAATVIFPKV